MRVSDKFVLHTFCITILSTFIPFKIYPITFVIFFIVVFASSITKKNISLIFLSLIFILYISFTFFVKGYDLKNGVLSYTKSIFNIFLFIFTCFSYSLNTWKSPEVSRKYLIIIEKYLRVILILSLIQILLLQLVSGGIRFSSESSYTAGLMFTEHTMFWGVQDKNMFGAKIALFGFLHAFVYLCINKKISYKYGFIYLLVSALTLSRTSLLLSLITFSILVFFRIKPKIRYGVILPLGGAALLLVLPKIATLMRLSSIQDTSMDDGMGIRIMFWSTFFKHLDSISWLGNGILYAGEFLGRYSPTGSANNMHNLYINIFLDLGYPGLLIYLTLIITLIYTIKKSLTSMKLSLIIILPLFILTNTLYTPYDNDPWVYLSFLIVLSKLASTGIKNEK